MYNMITCKSRDCDWDYCTPTHTVAYTRIHTQMQWAFSICLLDMLKNSWQRNALNFYFFIIFLVFHALIPYTYIAKLTEFNVYMEIVMDIQRYRNRVTWMYVYIYRYTYMESRIYIFFINIFFISLIIKLSPVGYVFHCIFFTITSISIQLSLSIDHILFISQFTGQLLLQFTCLRSACN